jgi:hypothetical protein
MTMAVSFQSFKNRIITVRNAEKVGGESRL